MIPGAFPFTMTTSYDATAFDMCVSISPHMVISLRNQLRVYGLDDPCYGLARIVPEADVAATATKRPKPRASTRVSRPTLTLSATDHQRHAPLFDGLSNTPPRIAPRAGSGVS